jgi:pectinesterase
MKGENQCTGRPTAPVITRYRCFLPDLAGLAGLRRVGPGTDTILPLRTQYWLRENNVHPKNLLASFGPTNLAHMRTSLLAAAVLLATIAYAQDVHVRVDPSAPSAAPGNEDRTVFPTIQNAMDHHPWAGPGGRVFIEIAPGTYHERVIITQNHSNITFIGKGKSPEDVVITNSLNAKAAGGTFFTETVEINGAGFEADNITFDNAAGNTGQAVAVADRADRSIFKHCRFLGHQDTLFADYGRQYYVDSYIEGGVDFIFGNATAVFDHSELHANGPGYLTAQSRTSANQSTGYVILNSQVTAAFDTPAPPADAPGAASTHSAHNTIGLGRPWRPYSRVIYINTSLPADLRPEGWNNWNNPANEKTAYYAESNSSGPGANPSARVPWSHQLSPAEAKQYLPAAFLRGSDNWQPEVEAAKLP